MSFEDSLAYKKGVYRWDIHLFCLYAGHLSPLESLTCGGVDRDALP